MIAVHRYEDLEVIRAVLEEFKPHFGLELGTAEGGFAAFLASVLKQWDGKLATVDIKQDPKYAAHLIAEYGVTVYETDILTPPVPQVLRDWLVLPGSALLYTDNGNKQRELELYVPLIFGKALIGTHDYGTEVNPEWVEAFMASQGYSPYHHDWFERLAHAEYYPVSLTRFWVKET